MRIYIDVQKSVRSSKKEAGDSLGETGRVQENEFPIQENKLAARDSLGSPDRIAGPIYFPGPGTHLKQRLKFHISAFPCTTLAAVARCTSAATCTPAVPATAGGHDPGPGAKEAHSGAVSMWAAHADLILDFGILSPTLKELVTCAQKAQCSTGRRKRPW